MSGTPAKTRMFSSHQSSGKTGWIADQTQTARKRREQDEVIAAEAALRRECCGAFGRRVHGAES